MFQLLKQCLVLVYFCLCCVPRVDCDDVLHMNGIAGQNLTVTLSLSRAIKCNDRVNLYSNNTKIHVYTTCNGSCFLPGNQTVPSIWINQSTIHLIFTPLMNSGVYHVAFFTRPDNIEESNKVNLTVYPTEYKTTYTTVTAPSSNNTSFQVDKSQNKPSILLLVPVLIVAIMLVTVLIGLFYWRRNRRNSDKAPAVSVTPAPQVVPDVTCVEYCVLDFPNRAGEKVRSTEERVEYSPIVFPPRKTTAKDEKIKSTAQQNKIKKNNTTS